MFRKSMKQPTDHRKLNDKVDPSVCKSNHLEGEQNNRRSQRKRRNLGAKGVGGRKRVE